MTEEPTVKPTRRRFLGALATAPLLPALGDAPAATTAAPPTPSPSPAPAPRAVDATARLLAQAVETRHGAHFEPGDLDVIAKGIGDALEGAARLRALRLGNADEPVTVFRARPPLAARDAGNERRGAAEFTSAQPRGGSRGDGAVDPGSR